MNKRVDELLKKVSELKLLEQQVEALRRMQGTTHDGKPLCNAVSFESNYSSNARLHYVLDADIVETLTANALQMLELRIKQMTTDIAEAEEKLSWQKMS